MLVLPGSNITPAEMFLLAGGHAFGRSREQNEIYPMDFHAIAYLLGRLGCPYFNASSFAFNGRYMHSADCERQLLGMEGRVFFGVEPSDFFSGITLIDSAVQTARRSLIENKDHSRKMVSFVELIRDHPTSFQLNCLACTDAVLMQHPQLDSRNYFLLSDGMLSAFPFSMVKKSHESICKSDLRFPLQEM